MQDQIAAAASAKKQQEAVQAALVSLLSHGLNKEVTSDSLEQDVQAAVS